MVHEREGNNTGIYSSNGGGIQEGVRVSRTAMAVGMMASTTTTTSNKNDHTDEPAIEREGLLLGDPSSAASTSAAASDGRVDTQRHRAGDQGEKKKARARNWREAEAGLAELLHGCPMRGANIGGPNRAEGVCVSPGEQTRGRGAYLRW